MSARSPISILRAICLLIAGSGVMEHVQFRGDKEPQRGLPNLPDFQPRAASIVESSNSSSSAVNLIGRNLSADITSDSIVGTVQSKHRYVIFSPSLVCHDFLYTWFVFYPCSYPYLSKILVFLIFVVLLLNQTRQTCLPHGHRSAYSPAASHGLLCRCYEYPPWFSWYTLLSQGPQQCYSRSLRNTNVITYFPDGLLWIPRDRCHTSPWFVIRLHGLTHLWSPSLYLNDRTLINVLSIYNTQV